MTASGQPVLVLVIPGKRRCAGTREAVVCVVALCSASASTIRSVPMPLSHPSDRGC